MVVLGRVNRFVDLWCCRTRQSRRGRRGSREKGLLARRTGSEAQQDDLADEDVRTFSESRDGECRMRRVCLCTRRL